VIYVAVNRQDLRRYDLEAWIHVHFYKIASIYSIIEALAILAHIAAPSGITECYIQDLNANILGPANTIILRAFKGISNDI